MMKLEFHDAPPPSTKGRRGLNPRLVEYMELLKANPGKWAKYPDPISGYARDRLSKMGFEAAMRNIPKGNKGDLWACWPTPKVRSRPNLKGRNVACSECEWLTGIEHVADLDKHTRLTHARPATKAERTPREAAA